VVNQMSETRFENLLKSLVLNLMEDGFHDKDRNRHLLDSDTREALDKAMEALKLSE
jgi:hypothetical protein